MLNRRDVGSVEVIGGFFTLVLLLGPTLGCVDGDNDGEDTGMMSLETGTPDTGTPDTGTSDTGMADVEEDAGECPETEEIDSAITEATTWGGEPGCVDYVLAGLIDVEAALTIEPGTRIEARQGGAIGLSVERSGSISAEGTEGNPVVFAGTEQMKGHWRGIAVHSTSTDNRFDWVEIADAGSSDWGGSANTEAALWLEEGRLAITNTTIRDSANFGLQARADASIEGFSDNIFENNDVPMWLHADRVGELAGSSSFSGNANAYIRVVFGSDTVGADATWKPFNVPYRLEGSAYVQAGLTIEPGAVFEFAQGKLMEVREGGTLTAVGTEDDPIIFRGTEDKKGFWRGISVESQSSDNKFDWVEVTGGGSSDWGGSADATKTGVWIDGGSLAITNTTFRKNADYALWAHEESSIAGFGNNTFENNDVPMRLHPNRVGELAGTSSFSGNSKPEVSITSGRFTTLDVDATWKSLQVPYRVYSRTKIQAGLTLEAGVTVEFAQDVEVWLEEGGTLTADGQSGSPVTLRGIEALQGYWQGLRIETASTDNKLTHTNLSHAGSSIWGSAPESKAAVYLYDGTVALDTVAIEDSGGNGFYIASIVGGTITSCSNVTFDNIAESTVFNASEDMSAGCGL